MNPNIRPFLYCLMALIIALGSALAVTPAFADDTTPPPTETPVVEETATPTEPPVVTEVAVTEVPTEVVPPPATEEALPVVAEPVADLLAEMPEGTDLIVLDGNGEALSLASEEAAQVVMEGDPIWCPVGIAPIANTGGCTASVASFADLVGLIQNKTVAGVIWVAGSYVGTSGLEGSDVLLSIGTVGTTANYALTIKGGWTGAGTATNPLDPSEFQVPLIINWNADVTLSDILITGITDGASTALDIDTPGKVSLTRVDVEENAGAGIDVVAGGLVTFADVSASDNHGGRGAYINNTSGTAGITMTGTSIYSDNLEDGLNVFTKGAITISNLIANSNGGWGVWLDNSTASGAMAVTLTGSNQFKFNYLGLYVESKGAITLNNITANQNSSDDGVVLINTASPTKAGVTLKGSNIFWDNGGNGLVINSAGAILLNNISADGNGTLGTGGYGAYLDNSYNLTTAVPVTLTGINNFSHNDSVGLWIDATGAVTLNKVTADGNGGDGINICNDWLGTSLPQLVSVIGYASSNNNNGDGVWIETLGQITIANLTATGNYGGNGAELDNCYDNGTGGCMTVTAKPITLTGTNIFEENAGNGLWINSKGAITLNNVIADSNGLAGAWLDNQFTGATGTVSVFNTATFGPSFSLNGDDGLAIFSNGNITVKDLIATDNGLNDDPSNLLGYGVYLDNSLGGGTGNVLLGTSRLNWRNDLSYNLLSGLEIFSNGTVTLNNLYARYNGHYDWSDIDGDFTIPVDAYGALIQNDGGLPKAVTLLGNNTFSDNVISGLIVYSAGAITVNNLRANWNEVSDGAYLDNSASGGGVPQNVVIKGYGNFYGNGGVGLWVNSYGMLTMANLDAEENQAGGAVLNNYQSDGVLAKPVLLTGNNFFDWNQGDGLAIYSLGAITISNLSAHDNGNTSGVGLGAWIVNDYSTTLPQNITISGYAEAYNNADSGLYVYSYGAISIANVYADNNGGNGAWLDNCDDDTTGGCYVIAAKPVTLTGSSYFGDNGGLGLFIISKGAITTNNVYSEYNDGTGAYLSNQFDGAIGAVTVANLVTAYPYFNNNGYDGLVILSNGNITVKDADASDNGWQSDPVYGFGMYLDNSSGGGTGNVMLGTSRAGWYNALEANYLSGLVVYTNGSITLYNVSASGNGNTDITPVGFGAYLQNDTAATPKPVTLLGANSFDGNVLTGLLVETDGAILLNNVSASGNDEFGASLVNDSSMLVPQNVTLNGYNDFSENGISGLLIHSHGLIVLNNITADGNATGFGVMVDNCGYDFGLSECTSTAAPKGVTINGTNSFNLNGLDGLFVVSYGPIKGNNITASDNIGGWGAYLDNQWEVSNQAVTLTGTNTFNGNDYGIDVYSNGGITISNLTASWNINRGAYLDNYSITSTSVFVTLTGSNTFMFNEDGDAGTTTEDGLVVYSDGNITINNLIAMFNGGNGAFLDNWYYWDLSGIIAAPPGLKLTGVNILSDNGLDGLYFDIVGKVDITKISADHNGGTGVYGYSAWNITITCGSMTDNGGNGWWLSAWNPGFDLITLKGVFAYGNTGGDTYLDLGVLTTVRTCPLP